ANQGTWTTYRVATLVYGVLGLPERVHLVEFDTGHGFPRPQREAVVRWMRRWLLEKDDAPTEPAFAIAKDERLQCTRSGQVLEDFKGKSVFHLNAEREKALLQMRSTQPWLTNEELWRQVRPLLAVPARVEAPKTRGLGHIKRAGYTIQ